MSEQQTAAQPWPENVTARYLTAAGATVDLTGEDYETEGLCNGCGETPAKGGYNSAQNDVVRMWAQRHATVCRAMARPEASA